MATSRQTHTFHADGYRSRDDIVITVIAGAISPVDIHLRPGGAERSDGPYFVFPLPFEDASPEGMAALLNTASHEGVELVTALPSVPTEELKGTAYLLILRQSE